MIESFKHLEEIAAGLDLVDVFLEADEQEHAVRAEQIVEALRRRRAVMRDCTERGRSSNDASMGKLVGSEARLLQQAFAEGRTLDVCVSPNSSTFTDVIESASGRLTLGTS